MPNIAMIIITHPASSKVLYKVYRLRKKSGYSYIKPPITIIATHNNEYHNVLIVKCIIIPPYQLYLKIKYNLLKRYDFLFYIFNNFINSNRESIMRIYFTMINQTFIKIYKSIGCMCMPAYIYSFRF